MNKVLQNNSYHVRIYVIQKRPDVHKIVFPPPRKSVNFEDLLLICAVFTHFGPFLGGGGQDQILRTRILWTPRTFLSNDFNISSMTNYLM